MDNSNSVGTEAMKSITANQQATMAPQITKSSGAGKAYQSVAQSTAIAVQDATDYLRNLSTISTTVTGVAMTQLLATGDSKTYGEIITNAQGLVSKATQDFKNIGTYATEILNDFPNS